jgi:hypothetical protein
MASSPDASASEIAWWASTAMDPPLFGERILFQ